MFVSKEPPEDCDRSNVSFAGAVAGTNGGAFRPLEDAENFGLFAPEFGAEVESSEFDSFAEALSCRHAWFAV